MNILYLIVFICLQYCPMLSGTFANIIIRINATLGGSVTLRLPERSGNHHIMDVTWIRADGNHFATTTPDGQVDVRDDDYEGRLRGSNDASLTISYIVTEDQGLYAANIALSDENNYIIKYNLSVLARSPDKVTRNGHKTSMLDACSMSCSTNNRDVILTCDRIRHLHISAVYDPDACTCGPWNADCAPCVLEEYCRKAVVSDGDRSRMAAVLVLVLMLVILVLLLPRCWKYCKKRKHFLEDLQISTNKLKEQVTVAFMSKTAEQ